MSTGKSASAMGWFDKGPLVPIFY